jgi:hypothetical protein
VICHWNWHVFLFYWAVLRLPFSDSFDCNFARLKSVILAGSEFWEVQRWVPLVFCVKLYWVRRQGWFWYEWLRGRVLRSKFAEYFLLRLRKTGLTRSHGLKYGGIFFPSFQIALIAFTVASFFLKIWLAVAEHTTVPQVRELIARFGLSLNLTKHRFRTHMLINSQSFLIW